LYKDTNRQAVHWCALPVVASNASVATSATFRLLGKRPNPLDPKNSFSGLRRILQIPQSKYYKNITKRNKTTVTGLRHLFVICSSDFRHCFVSYSCNIYSDRDLLL